MHAMYSVCELSASRTERSFYNLFLGVGFVDLLQTRAATSAFPTLFKYERTNRENLGTDANYP